MEKKATHFLTINLVAVSLFCIAVFISQTVGISVLGESAIRRLGVFYMSGISDQVASRFGTTIELRLSQVESLVNSVPPGRITGETAMQVALAYNARSAGFEYLAFYTEDGGFRMICGSQVTADVPEALRRSVQGGRYNVSAGKDAGGNPVVLLGVPAIYPMGDGESSVALVAGLSAGYLRGALETNLQRGSMEYAIIRTDGSYVLRDGLVEEDNYFDRAERLYEPCNGKDPSQYVRELQEALAAGRDYAGEILVSGQYWNVYCTDLPDSEWHLLLKISHNTMDETINALQGAWISISIIGGCLIIFALLLVFAGYYRLTRLQMRALDDARRTAEQAQQSAERSNRAKNEFLSNMSHDIRTPMNGIMGMTAIAIGSLDDPPRVRSCLKRIHISSRHLLGLINDMLDMSKIESGSLTLNVEPLSLREIMQNITTVIQPQVQEKNQSFRIYVHDIYHENVCADRVRLSQILLNILGNAVKFTPEGGVIEADLYEEPSPKGEEYVRSRLEISDNGIGMSKEFQSRIFDAFAREDSARVEKAAGAGMGMTITKYIVDAMDGDISVESEQGKGSRFRVTLDLEKTAAREKELRLPERNVLVVDDDETERALAVSALESVGLRAACAPDLERAYRMLEEGRGGAPYHAVLLDWGLRGSGGPETARELSGRCGLPIVLLTDGEWDETEEEGTLFLSKPLFRSGLYYALRPLIEAQAPPPPAQEEETVPDLEGRRILIAEDNELNWEIASELLGSSGLETEWAENGRICVEKFGASAPGWYDAILMDLRMPEMSGLEAAAAIRKLPRADAKAVPIIAVSADAFADDVQKCLDAGMNAHLPKPLAPQRVFRLLEQYFT